MAADEALAIGEELSATYGAHSNDKLLVHYGFVGPESSIDDDIRLDHMILPWLDETVCAQLQDVGFLGGYALLPATNEVCFKTQVAIRASMLTCNEWEYFVACGEDLATDHTGAVNDYVRSLLAVYREDAVRKLEDVRNSRDGVHQNVLELRWNQIINGIDAFAKV